MKKIISIPHAGADNVDILDYSAIESLEEFREAVADAGVIVAFDKRGKDRSTYIVYGREVLTAIASHVIPPQDTPIVRFGINTASDELEHIAAAVQTTRGFHELKGES